jgi:uncharacterized protein with HEPN domain
LSTKNNTLYLGHIRDAIDKIEQYIANIDYNSFIRNEYDG